MDGAGGSVPDAVDHLLHDPVAFSATVMGDAARRSSLATALAGLISGASCGCGHAELAGRRGYGHPRSRRPTCASWTQPAQGRCRGRCTRRSMPGRPDVQLVLGAAGASPAGGGRVTLKTTPALSVVGEWHRPGTAAPETVQLWPAPDAAAILRLAARLAPAELGRVVARVPAPAGRRRPSGRRCGVRCLRAARGRSGWDGLRNVRLPLALIQDPLGWFSHADALGAAAGGLDPAKTVASARRAEARAGRRRRHRRVGRRDRRDAACGHERRSRPARRRAADGGACARSRPQTNG